MLVAKSIELTNYIEDHCTLLFANIKFFFSQNFQNYVNGDMCFLKMLFISLVWVTIPEDSLVTVETVLLNKMGEITGKMIISEFCRKKWLGEELGFLLNISLNFMFYRFIWSSYWMFLMIEKKQKDLACIRLIGWWFIAKYVWM